MELTNLDVQHDWGYCSNLDRYYCFDVVIMMFSVACSGLLGLGFGACCVAVALNLRP